MMIEVRQAFYDLGSLLAKFEGRSYKMPKSASLQFDNCGVNKVKSSVIIINSIRPDH